MALRLSKSNIVEDLYHLNEKSIIHADVTLRRALLYISENYQENISTRNVANECGVSADYISHIIKYSTDRTCSQLIRELKLIHASELIKNENYTLTDIAYAIGFCDLSHFSRNYKKKYGISPNAQRKKYTTLAQKRTRHRLKHPIEYSQPAIKQVRPKGR